MLACRTRCCFSCFFRGSVDSGLFFNLAILVFIRWRKTTVYGADGEHKLDSSSGRILGRLRGKGGGGLNLGNFFASHKGYSRKGFDRLSTEGSDQEKDEDDGTDSEEECSAPPPPPAPSSS